VNQKLSKEKKKNPPSRKGKRRPISGKTGEMREGKKILIQGGTPRKLKERTWPVKKKTLKKIKAAEGNKKRGDLLVVGKKKEKTPLGENSKKGTSLKQHRK